MSRPRRLIILAAGTGTRLRPLTDDRPKCLVPLLGRPLLDWQIDAASRIGISDIVIVGGHHADRLDGRGLSVVVNADYAETNMVHSLFAARAHFGDGFVLAYGDIAYRPSVLRAVRDAEAAIAVAVDRDWRSYWAERFDDPLSDAETLAFGPDGMIRDIGRKPRGYEEIEAQYIGLMAFDRAGVAALATTYDRLRDLGPEAMLGGRKLAKAFMTDLLQELIRTHHALTPVKIDGGWVEIDSRRDLDLAERLARQGRLDA
jgi:L-glutamine-phosphate cytidylyltransferase